jgi:hypothetical protein
MKMRPSPRDDTAFDAAWRAFVRADMETAAPPDLEGRVRAAVAHAQAHGRRSPPTRRWMLWTAAAAAAALVMTTAVWRWSAAPRESSPRAAIVVAERDTAALVALRSPLAPMRPTRPRGAIVPRPAIDGDAPVALPPVLMILSASPLRDTEALQLVRLRLPREALQTLGVALLEPDAGGVIDVDVLVGEDGLARDIRYVRTGQERIP